MKRSGPIKRKTRLKAKRKRKWRPSAEGRAFWSDLRKAVWKEHGPRCAHCSEVLVWSCWAAAHVHGLGRGRSRYNPSSQCSRCETLLNSVGNLRVVCRSGPCNDAVALPCSLHEERRRALLSKQES